MIGKLHPNLLRKYVFSRIGAVSNRVLVGPAYGEDAAIIDFGDEVLVIHTDPITGAVENLGWLAVNIACNDIAVCGARPKWLLSVFYFPENCDESLIDRITEQVDKAAKELEVMIIGGHSEFTPSLKRPLITMTALGIAKKERYVTTKGCKSGDLIIITKSIGIEGTSILATDFQEGLRRKGVDDEKIERGRKFIRNISVVKEALILADIGVNAMHDPTEGGVLGGLAEMAYSSGKRIEVWESKIPVSEITQLFCKVLNLDPLKLISSGALLASIPKDMVEIAIKKLSREGIPATVIGEVKEGEGLVVHRNNGRIEKVGPYVEDELIRLWTER